MKVPREKKEAHSIVGKHIKLILSITPADYKLRWEETAYAGDIHTIIDRPTRKSRKNGDAGVWIEGRLGPVFAWFFTWEPYTAPVRTVFKMSRTKQPPMVRTNAPMMRRSK